MCANFAVSAEVALEAVVTVAALAFSNPLAVISVIQEVTSVFSVVLPTPNAILAKATGESTAVSNLAVSTNPYLVPLF